MNELTQKQADTLAFIKGFIADNSYSPSREEVGKNFGIFPNAAQLRISALIKKGALTEAKGIFRSIAPVKGFRVRVKAND